MNEFDYIARIRAQTPPSPRTLIGPGDDCAMLRGPNHGHWLVTTDMLLDGVHFDLGKTDPRRIGRKAMSVNLSDIAAMGGRPVAALVSVGLPAQGQVGDSLPDLLYLGLRDRADAFATAIVGGDTNVWPGPLAISVTLLGDAGPAGAIRRAGAQPGDWLLVTGPLGGSILGKHLDFVPRVAEGLALAQTGSVHAMIDISDGLAADAHHLAEESGCGVVLVAEAIPISGAAQAMPGGKTPLEHALGDGEDFELLFCAAEHDARALLANPPTPGMTLHHVGFCVPGEGLFLETGGVRQTLPPLGYVHRI